MVVGVQLSEIKEMTARDRLRERKIQELKRRGRPVDEASLAAVEAELRLQFNSPRTMRGITGCKVEEQGGEEQSGGQKRVAEAAHELEPAAE